MDATSVAEMLSIGKILLFVSTLSSVTVSIFAIAAFFRRQPSLDKTIADLIESFNRQLQTRARVDDLRAAEGRLEKQISDSERRSNATFQTVLAEIREVRKSQDGVLRQLTDLYRDGGWSRGKLEGK